jgi:thiamine-monophosphate kinase
MSDSLFNENRSKTPLSELGEFGLINRLTKDFPVFHKETRKGVGDDAAVIQVGDKSIVVTTDMLAEAIHFDLTYVPLKHLGYKAAIVNFSDVYAMNAIPKQITVSIALSNRFPVEAIDELYEGIKKACKMYQVDLVGGDTISSKAGLIISITAIGEGETDKIVYRNGAQENDIIMVSGDLGGAYMGLKLLEREKQVFIENPLAKPELEGYDYIIERQLKPEARLDIIELLNELHIVPTSMIDISDGLASEILHLTSQSNRGCRIMEDKIPIDQQTFSLSREFGIDPTVCALSGGEDYELLFTIKQSDFEKLKNSALVTPIGFITHASKGTILIDKTGNEHQIVAQGWKSF